MSALTRFVNGFVWSNFDGEAWSVSDEVLVRDGKIAAVGSGEPASSAIEIDLEGGTLLPGFGDGHVHPLFAGRQAMYAPVADARTMEELFAIVAQWAAANPEAQWVRGDGCSPWLAPEGICHAEWLDAIVPDRPVALWTNDFHTMWVNTRALELAGIAPETTTGTLREWQAWGPVAAVLPDLSDAHVSALAFANQRFAECGITWVQDAWVESATADAWLAAEAAGVLTVRADLALLADADAYDIDALKALRARVSGSTTGALTAHTVKFFADGVIESGTGALLADYCGCPGDRGMLVWEPQRLASAVADVVAAGFSPHIHAIGDAGVRVALDAIEHARHQHGHAGHAVIAHAQLVDAADLQRFAELGVIANFEPLWACLDDEQLALAHPRLGQARAAQQYRIGSLMRSGAVVSFGSDWPVTDVDPRAGIATAVTRSFGARGVWLPEERISVGAAVAAYTRGVALQAGQAHEWGSILPGCRADLVWLDADLRSVDPGTLASVAIRGTWLGGIRTHQ